MRAISVNAVGPEAYHRDQQLARDVGAHFRSTLERMTRIAESVGADILFVVPASNLLDFAPLQEPVRARVLLGDSRRSGNSILRRPVRSL